MFVTQFVYVRMYYMHLNKSSHSFWMIIDHVILTKQKYDMAWTRNTINIKNYKIQHDYNIIYKINVHV